MRITNIIILEASFVIIAIVKFNTRYRAMQMNHTIGTRVITYGLS